MLSVRLRARPSMGVGVQARVRRAGLALILLANASLVFGALQGEGLQVTHASQPTAGAPDSAQGAALREPLPTPQWEPVSSGIDLARLQVNLPRLAVLHVVRVDLHTPCLAWLATPGAAPDAAPLAPPGRHAPETIGLKTSTFLLRHGLLLAINAAPFGPVIDEEGLLMDVAGFQVSQGRQVSGPTKNYPALLIMEDGAIRIQGPPFPLEGVRNGVGGFDILLQDGRMALKKPVSKAIHPRTAVGLSGEGRWMWILVVDGRQPEYSLGASLEDLAIWFQDLGAREAINLDGGGTSTLVIRQADGTAKVINRPIHRNIPGLERVSASHLGIWIGDPQEAPSGLSGQPPCAGPRANN